MVSDMRSIIRAGQGRQGQPSAVVLDGRTLQSSVESGERTGYESYKRRKGSKVHMAVDTPGHLIDLTVTPADEQDRSQVKALCQAVQEATSETVEVAWADQGYTGQQASQDAKASGIELRVVKLPEARKGLCCCRGAGWWSAASLGWPVFGDYRAISSACLRCCWQRCISWCLPLSCCPRP